MTGKQLICVITASTIILVALCGGLLLLVGVPLISVLVGSGLLLLTMAFVVVAMTAIVMWTRP